MFASLWEDDDSGEHVQPGPDRVARGATRSGPGHRLDETHTEQSKSRMKLGKARHLLNRKKQIASQIAHAARSTFSAHVARTCFSHGLT